MSILAIDPGQNGSTCCLPTQGDIVFADHNKYSSIDLYTFMRNSQASVVAIEDVHSLFGMSAKSNFRFGYNLGLITTLSELLDIPIIKIQPKVWQKYIGCTKPSGKQLKKEVAEIANNLYPQAPLYGARGGLLDGRSDALMLAHFIKQNHKDLL